MVKKSLAIDPYSFEPTTSSVFTWGFVLDPLEVLLYAFGILQTALVEVQTCFSQGISLYLVTLEGQWWFQVEKDFALREEQVGRCLVWCGAT